MDLCSTPGYVAGLRIELNLRDLGGMPTDDGRRVRHGNLFRGSALSGLTAEETARIDELGLSFILDLRAQGKAASAPDHVPVGASYLRCGGMRTEDGEEVDFSPTSIERLQRRQDITDDFGGFMRALYVAMAFGNPATHTLVEHLSAYDTPLYFHCTAGKDRTGVCALIVGMVLGVTRDAMLADFMLTNEYRRSIIENVASTLPADTPPEIIKTWQKANGVQLADAEAVLDAITERYDTSEAYLASEFGLGSIELERLRSRYLEHVDG